jgi:hypothetical protein
VIGEFIVCIVLKILLAASLCSSCYFQSYIFLRNSWPRSVTSYTGTIFYLTIVAGHFSSVPLADNNKVIHRLFSTFYMSFVHGILQLFPTLSLTFLIIYMISIVFSWTIFYYTSVNYLYLRMFVFYFTNFCPPVGLDSFDKYWRSLLILFRNICKNVRSVFCAWFFDFLTRREVELYHLTTRGFVFKLSAHESNTRKPASSTCYLLHASFLVK